ncbi:hypothetical protein D9V37_08855 [Nocardioides mangrovicus]|uniref:Leucine-binding protein domain-containing protein n=1 Tax=Nocardioides mangrovicus TaxID=2478913 RepID=A0A3L8P5C6_9ACTN|nr:ABC transporter substrate-binding protein [Nocardioides mangrovicus]RLV49973.1 hypothetical protein D9V37_08855 [Nocardioides mangrovicus]
MSAKLGPKVALAAGMAAVAMTAAACGSSSGGSSSGSSSSSASTNAGVNTSVDLGAANAASGTPIVFGVLNLQSGPVTFPEVLQAEQAAVKYVNAYKGGIGGHPIKLVTCATDGTPATSARCANQIADQKPVAILGGADTGAPGAIPVWQRLDLAYIGGVPFTPVEQNYKNAVIFSSVSTSDNAAASVYAAKKLGVKKAAVIYTSDTQGTATGEGVIIPTMKNAGITSVTKVGLSPTASDVSSAVASAMGASPDLIYVDAPAACPNILSSLKQLGYKGKLMGVDPCTSPKAIKGANGGADGLIFASPTLDPTAGTDETNLMLTVLKKYAPDTALDSLASIGFQSVMNLQSVLGKSAPADLTTDKILAAFRTGSAMANFMGHDYTCDGKQLAGATAVCNTYEQMREVKGSNIAVAAKDFFTAGSYYKPTS